jgi:hypothetical protein
MNFDIYTSVIDGITYLVYNQLRNNILLERELIGFMAEVAVRVSNKCVCASA